MDGQEIKDKRLSLHMTQQQFADELEVSRRSVVDWEADKSRPSVGTLRRIKELHTVAPPRARKYAPDAVISPKTHPQCFIVGRADVKDHYYRTLQHPRWFASLDCNRFPFYKHIPEGQHAHPTVAEYDAYEPLTPETVWEIFKAHRVREADAIEWMQRRGHKQFGEIEKAKTGFADMLESSAGEATLDDMAKAGVAMRIGSNAPITPYVDDLPNDSESLQRALDEAFTLPTQKD